MPFMYFKIQSVYVWGLHWSWELVLKVLHNARCDFMTYCSRLQTGKRMWDLGWSTFIFIINFELKLFIWRWTFYFALSLESLFINFLPFCFLVSLPSSLRIPNNFRFKFLFSFLLQVSRSLMSSVMNCLRLKLLSSLLLQMNFG